VSPLALFAQLPPSTALHWSLDLLVLNLLPSSSWVCFIFLEKIFSFYLFTFFFRWYWGFEFRASCLLERNFTTFLCWVFLRWGLVNYLLMLTSNGDPPDLCLLSS
jgi:hypothetical protein